jgi:uncharacterized protein YkwD
VIMVRLFIALLILDSAVACSPSHGGPEPENPIEQGGGVTLPVGLKLSCEEARFVKLLNMYRKQAQNLNAVTVSKNGVTAARWHANDMGEKGYMGHTEPDGRDYIARMAYFGFGGWAENAAAGVYTGQDVFCLWRNSPGHNSNMLGFHGSIGIGMAVVGGSQYGAYWSNGFGPSAPDPISEPLTDDANCPLPSSIPGC